MIPLLLLACRMKVPMTDGMETMPQVRVTGTGEAEGAPDEATAVLGVSIVRESADDAIAEAKKRIDAVSGVLLGMGVPPEAIQTRSLQVHPDYQEPVPDQPLRPSRVRAHFTLEVELTDLAQAGETLDAALAASGSEAVLDSFSFGISNPAPLLEEARTEAWNEVRAAAEQYAGLSGGTLGELLRLEERSDGPWGPPAHARAEAMVLDVQPGTLAVAVTLEASFALEGSGGL